MTALEVLTTLHRQGVILIRRGDRVRVEAPAGVLSDAMQQAIRRHKDTLLTLLELWEERSAIMEFEAGMPRAEAEACAWCLLQATDLQPEA